MKGKRLALATMLSALLMTAIFAPPLLQSPNNLGSAGVLTVVGTLTSARASAAPTLDGSAGDVAWGEATAITITVSGGANTVRSTQVSLKSVYIGDMIYFVAQWADPQDSKDRFPWFYNITSAKWEQKGDTTSGDANLYYEDKLAILWNIGDSIVGFNEDEVKISQVDQEDRGNSGHHGGSGKS